MDEETEKILKTGAYIVGGMAVIVMAWKLAVEFPKAYRNAGTMHEKLSSLSILI